MTKHAKLRIIIVALILVSIIGSCLIFSVSCSGAIDESNTNQDSEVDEPDIVKMTDDGFIIKLQPDGVTVTKTENGMLSIAKKQRFSAALTPTDLITYDKYLIAIVTLSNVYTYVSFYDMEELNDGTDRLEPLRETIFFGSYYTSRVTDGKFYMISVSTQRYYTYNEASQTYVENGTKDSIYDSVYEYQYFTQLNKGSAYNNGYLMSMLDLSDIPTGKYTLSAYLSSYVIDLYFSRYALYIITMQNGAGCGYNPQYVVTKISISELKVMAKTKARNGIVPNRYYLYDNGENLFVLSTYNSSTLAVYDKDMKDVAAINELILNSSIGSVYYDAEYCYIITNRTTEPAFKIDIRSAKNPTVVGYTNITATAGLMYQFNEDFFITVSTRNESIEVSYYDASFEFPYLVNTVTLSAQNTMASKNRKAAFMSYSENFFGFASEAGAHVFKVDEYGYLEAAALLPTEEGTPYEFARVKLFEGIIYAIYSNRITSYTHSTFTQIDTLPTTL